MSSNLYIDSLSNQGFNYSNLDDECLDFVQQQTSEIRSLIKRTAQDIIEIGQRLIKVKKLLGYGQYRKWIKAEFNWGKSTAYSFENVAKQFADVQNLDIFAASALYELAAPSTPKAARDEAIALAQAGKRISYKTAKAIKQKYSCKPPKHQSTVSPLEKEEKPATANRQALNNHKESLERISPSVSFKKPSDTTLEYCHKGENTHRPVSGKGMLKNVGIFKTPPQPQTQGKALIAVDRAMGSNEEPSAKDNSKDLSIAAFNFEDSTSSSPQLDKQKVIEIYPQEITKQSERSTVVEVSLSQQWWQLGSHHLYCGEPSSKEFQDRLPDRIALAVAFPSTVDWNWGNLESRINSSLTLFSSYDDVDLKLFREMLRSVLELYTDGQETVFFAFVPDPALLLLAESLDCQCFIAESNKELCQAVIQTWQKIGGKVKALSTN